MSEKEEHYEKRRRRDSSSSSSSDSSSSSSSYSSASDNGDRKPKKIPKYDEEVKILRKKDEKRSSPDRKDGAKSYYDHRSSKERHRSRERKRERTRSKSKERKRERTRSRSRDKKKERSRSRSRSRDRKRERSYRRSRSPGHRHISHRHSRTDHDHRRRSRSRSYDRSMSRKSYNKSLKKLNMLEKLGIELKVPEGQPTAAQPTQLPGGITIPSYYNPAGVNPLKYVQQMQKRKLLWGNSQKQTTQTSAAEKVEEKAPVGPETVWKGTSFSNDQDGKLTAKFKRLMGIKTTEEDKPSAGSGSSLIKKQEEIFESMEKQYEVARVATHTHRGLGLGFGVHQPR